MIDNNVMISVIMPAYNEEKFIGEAIDSILNQTYNNFELIIIDDGSEDQTKKIVKSYKDSRIVLVELSENKGNRHAANVGLKKARGKYIARCDADDISFEYRFEIQYEFMEKNPDIGYCGGALLFFGDQSGQLFYPETDEEMRVLYLFGNAVSQGTSMFRSNLITKYNLYYNEEGGSFAEDYHYFFKMSKCTFGANLQKLLIKYRRHDNNVTKNIGSEKITLSHKVLKEVIDHYFFLPDQKQLKIHDFLRNGGYNETSNSLSLKKIFNWIRLLLKENKKKKTLNHKILRKYLYQKWGKLFFVLVDKKEMSFKKIFLFFWMSKTFSLKKIYYYFKILLN